MALWRRLDRSMPCLSSPLSRVASALLAFLHSGNGHHLLSPRIHGMLSTLSHREMRCRHSESSGAGMLERVQQVCQAVMTLTF